MGCANVAHAFAGAAGQRQVPRRGRDARPTSASSLPTTTCCRRTRRMPGFPDVIKDEARKHGATAQVAGGVPAMCDGVTQGTAGMELSLFSRDVIAMATAVALSHDVFDARADAGHLRQDRAGPADRRPALRPPAHGVRARRADAQRPVQQREGQGARAGGARPGRPRGAAGGRDAGLSHAGHLHLLRHGQQQPDADGGDGPARAGHRLRQAGQRAARGADARGSAHRAGHRARRAATRRSAAWWTSAPSSMRWRRCWRPAARPTT